MKVSDLTTEQIETYADPSKSAVSLIYDLKGNVIGNSQHLAKTLLTVAKAIDQFAADVQAACDKLDDIKAD